MTVEDTVQIGDDPDSKNILVKAVCIRWKICVAILPQPYMHGLSVTHVGQIMNAFALRPLNNDV
jgi:hypothetical protein